MHRIKRHKSWFRRKAYTHLGAKVYEPKREIFVRSYVRNTQAIARHAFFPLIHRQMIQRRYKLITEKEIASGRRAHKYVEDGEIKTTAKIREIYYASHIDAQIYSFYASEILGPLYEKVLSSTSGLSECVCAYRRIRIDGSNRNKYNVHFAKDVFDYIKATNECVALTFDVSKFFDSLNHNYLKRVWANLLKVALLPADHFNIYQSLTLFSYVEFVDLLREFSIPHEKELRRRDIPSFCENPIAFRNRVRGKGLIKKNPYKDDTGIKIGIPQGTALSAFLANLYMLEFDQQMFQRVVLSHSGIYRRYSDDIVVVCNPQDKENLESFILNLIKEFNLLIQPAKTLVSEFVRDEQGLMTCNSPLKYLGFEFNGQRTLLKSSSLSKFYRNMKLVVKIKAKKANGGLGEDRRIFKYNIYKRFSHLGRNGKKRNYITYAFDAAKIMQASSIKRQVSRAWKKLEAELKKYEVKYKLQKYR